MVRLGFIVEGHSEKVLISSKQFREFAMDLGIEICDPVINAKGGGNLKNENIQTFIDICRDIAQPDKIFVLTDLENDPCIASIKERIGKENVDAVIVSRKALEAWFIADSKAMCNWLQEEFYCAFPEQTLKKPFEFLKDYTKEKGKRGPGFHLPFAKRMTSLSNFSLERAASHPNCPSAAYFLEKLKSLRNESQTL